MAGCIAGIAGAWFLCLEACVAFSILKALIPGDMVWCIGFLIYFHAGTVSTRLRWGGLDPCIPLQPGVGG